MLFVPSLNSFRHFFCPARHWLVNVLVLFARLRLERVHSWIKFFVSHNWGRKVGQVLWRQRVSEARWGWHDLRILVDLRLVREFFLLLLLSLTHFINLQLFQGLVSLLALLKIGRINVRNTVGSEVVLNFVHLVLD